MYHTCTRPTMMEDQSDCIGLRKRLTMEEDSDMRIFKRKSDKVLEIAKPLKKNKHCRASKAKWTAEEDEILTRAVLISGEGNWKKIAQSLNDRSHLQCLHRWQKVLNPALVKGPWKEEEDMKLGELVDKYGPKDWSTIASHIPGRIGKQCRERWFNHLSPDVRKTNWTPEEDDIIIDAHHRLGNKWTAISKLLDGRPANAIKNHWNSTLLKRIQQDSNGGPAPRRDRIRNKIKMNSKMEEHSANVSPQPSPVQLQLSPASSPGSPVTDAPVPMLTAGRFQYQVPEATVYFNPFSDQPLAWDWPAIVSPVHHHAPPSSYVNTAHQTHSSNHNHNNNVAMGMGIGMGMNTGFGLFSNSNDGFDQSLDFMSLCQPQSSSVLAPTELQYCFDHHAQDQVESLGIALDGYSPLPDSPNVSLSMLNLDVHI